VFTLKYTEDNKHPK